MATKQYSEELIFVCLKFGIQYQSIQINRNNPNVIQELQQEASSIVAKSVLNLEALNNLHHIELFLISPDHQPANLKLITRAADLTPACFIEIVIWRSDPDPIAIPHEHVLYEHNYKKPTYCSVCDYFMWGLLKQGKRCKICRRDFHHQCAEHLRMDCPGPKPKNSKLNRRTSSTTTIDSSQMSGSVYIDTDTASHHDTSSKKNKFRVKLFNGSKSKNGSKTSSISSTTNSTSLSSMGPPTPRQITEHSKSRKDSSSVISIPPEITNGKDQRSSGNQKDLPVTHFHFPKRPDARSDVKITSCTEKDGVWMATGQCNRESRHSRRVQMVFDRKKIKFVDKNENGSEQVFEISVANIEKSRTKGSEKEAAKLLSEETGASEKQALVYQQLASALIESINEVQQTNIAIQPLTPKFTIVRGSGNDNKAFSEIYEINEREILGMGRFGKVYGGAIRRNGVRVAIKRIQLSQCTTKDRENIEQEASYLFQLNHPGILKFEGIFEFEQHFIIVTERLDIDMLNFILSNTNPKARLDEDMTRFLAFQLVAAIRYLHFKNIAHCDLKPDNVLINMFPNDIVHLKVGDFGYARTISDHSVRYTKVGTTAYLPPEVSHDEWRHLRGYNKTVDMWAIGVIIFVSLSGYFPFHEDQDIRPQLENIPKLFEEDTFSHVTAEVKDLLQFRLLVPEAGHRMHSAGVIYHDWFQKSRQLLNSCRKLEECLAKKWLTLFFEEPEAGSDGPFNYGDDSDSS